MQLGYCVKERKHVEIANVEEVIMKNGTPALRGNCPDCGTKIFKIKGGEKVFKVDKAKKDDRDFEKLKMKVLPEQTRLKILDRAIEHVRWAHEMWAESGFIEGEALRDALTDLYNAKDEG